MVLRIRVQVVRLHSCSGFFDRTTSSNCNAESGYDKPSCGFSPHQAARADARRVALLSDSRIASMSSCNASIISRNSAFSR